MTIINSIKNYFVPTEPQFDLSLENLLNSINEEIKENETFFNLCSDKNFIDVLIYKSNYLHAYKSYVISLMKNEYRIEKTNSLKKNQ